MMLAIAVLFSDTLKVDIRKQDEYSKLTPAQKTFVQKIADEHPVIQEHINQPQRVTEQQIVQDVAQVAQTDAKAKTVRIVTVGDASVCEKCHAWENREVSLDENVHPSLQDAINGGFLHYGCRCSLQEIKTAEIPLNKINPRYDERRAANPAAYHHDFLKTEKLVFA